VGILFGRSRCIQGGNSKQRHVDACRRQRDQVNDAVHTLTRVVSCLGRPAHGKQTDCSDSDPCLFTQPPPPSTRACGSPQKIPATSKRGVGHANAQRLSSGPRQGKGKLAWRGLGLEKEEGLGHVTFWVEWHCPKPLLQHRGHGLARAFPQPPLHPLPAESLRPLQPTG
jgi:hypothetical protein